MRSLWINSTMKLLLGFLIWAPLLAQEPPAVEAQSSAPARKAAAESSKGGELGEVFTILRAFQPDEALVAIEASSLNESLKSLFRGWAYHQKGRYEEAVKHFDQVDKERLQGEGFLLNRLEELRKTGLALNGFESMETENFVIRFQEGHDRVMTFYLPDILERIYSAYSEMFAFERKEKVLVELMPDHELFSYASALSRKQIETTGTIALCVENRLVVLTPRRVLQGYEWPDTIAHEFVHYILTKKSRDHAPLWLQEGVAKYFEARWRENDGSFLDPGMESSLATAVESGEYLTIEQMMPSFAALPTAALARQAYAQTASMVDYMVKLKEVGIVQQMVTRLGMEPSMDAVLKASFAMDFATFESAWQKWTRDQGYRNYETIAHGGVTLLDKDQNAGELGEASLETDLGKKHTRLGDLLLERQRYQAALKEYYKTLETETKPSRQMALRILTCLEVLDQVDAMIAFVETQVPFPERDPTMLGYLAEGHLRKGQQLEARALLERAIFINPFNPMIFQKLLTALDREKEPEEVQKAEEILKILTKPKAEPAGKKDIKS